MPAVKLPEFMEKIINSIIKKNGFQSFEMNFESGSTIGIGFSCELLGIRVIDRKSDAKLDLVCKITYKNDYSILYKREALLYEELMPIFHQFQVERKLSKDDQFVSYPKCYATNIAEAKNKFVIIMEDLRKTGFKLWDKTIPSPIENVRLAMKELGKFHGLSIALKDQKPEEFEQFKQVKDIMKKGLQVEQMTKLFQCAFHRAINLLKNQEHKNIMHDIRTNMHAYLDDCLDENAAERFGVLCHGDFWTNNTMFKFNDQGVAEEIRILDWQVIRYSSPATDILLNLFTSTDKSLRDKEYDNLIALYYQSLSKTVKLLGSNPDKLFTMANLKDEFRRFGNYVLFMAPILICSSQVDLTKISRMHDMFESNTKDEIFDISSVMDEKSQTEYARRLGDVIDDIIDLGYYHQIS